MSILVAGSSNKKRRRRRGAAAALEPPLQQQQLLLPVAAVAAIVAIALTTATTVPGGSFVVEWRSASFRIAPPAVVAAFRYQRSFCPRCDGNNNRPSGGIAGAHQMRGGFVQAVLQRKHRLLLPARGGGSSPLSIRLLHPGIVVARGTAGRSISKLSMAATSDERMAANDDGGETKKVYPPSRFVIDEQEGNKPASKWRLAAACAVLNSRNELLVGERIGVPGSWQAPQGGVDDAWEEEEVVADDDEGQRRRQICHEAETIERAAVRELYEETGLVNGRHVVMLGAEDGDALGGSWPEPARYETGGTGSWLSRGGFAGQELHWRIFRCVDGRLDYDPRLVACNLESECRDHDEEDPEFSNIRWTPLDDAVKDIWEKKRQPYMNLLKWFQREDFASNWNERCRHLDLSGTWLRDAAKNRKVADALVSRGIPEFEAAAEAIAPYRQTWTRRREGEEERPSLVWNVKTYDEDSDTAVRRDLDYPVGTWTESYEGKSLLFDSSKDDEKRLKRYTAYVVEPEADDPTKLAHVTITWSSTGAGKGMEESRRYLKNGNMILKRSFWPNVDKHKKSIPVESTEVFVRVSSP